MSGHVPQLLMTATATSIAALQGRTILDTDTLLPAGIWIVGVIVVWRASWRVSCAIQQFVNRMENVERRMDSIEKIIEEIDQ